MKTGFWIRITWFVSLLLLSYKLSGSIDTTIITQKKYKIGITPTALFNRLPGLQLTQSYEVKPWLSFDLESVFSFDLLTVDPRFVKNLGYRIRPGIKIHINRKNPDNIISLRFLAHYRYVILHFEEDEIPRANGAYFENIREKIYSSLLGFGANLDFQFRFYDANLHLGFGYIIGRQNTRYSSDLITGINSSFIRPLITPGRKKAIIPILYVHFLF